MPYSTGRGGFERASKLGHVPLAESEFVKAKLQSSRFRAPDRRRRD